VEEVQAGALPAAAGKVPPVQVAWPVQAPGPPHRPEPPEWLEPPDPAWEDWEAWEDGMNKPWPMSAVHAVEREIKPEPSESQAPALGSQCLQEKAHLGMGNRQERLQVRLFGREAAHTLEIGPHRRGDSFMGVQVVTVESARALAGGGYDWGRKLAVQLTPEEMPAAIAVLMNLSSSARFGQHGVDRDKFVELRRQEGGLVVVTGQAGSVYAVPVRTATLYYLLSLFARAMARDLPGNTIADVLALVKASH